MAINLPSLRTDDNGYVEGLAFSKYVDYGIYLQSWLQDGVTASFETTTSGKLLVPEITGVGGTVTQICTGGTPSIVSSTYIPIEIGHKVSEKVDGCFVSAQIYDHEQARALNNTRLRLMGNTIQEWAIKVILGTTGESMTKGTTASITSAYKDPYTFINFAQLEYQMTTGYLPNVALCSPDFAGKVLASQVNLMTAQGDQARTYGQLGMVSGMRLIPIPSLTNNDLIVYNNIFLKVVTPSSVTDINQPVISEIDMNSLNISFDRGIMTLYEIMAQSGIVYTWLHKFFEIAIPIDGSVRIYDYMPTP